MLNASSLDIIYNIIVKIMHTERDQGCKMFLDAYLEYWYVNFNKVPI